MIRYYIANMCEKSGEYSFDTLIRFALREPEKDFFNTPEEISYQKAEKYCDELAQFWYDSEEEGLAKNQAQGMFTNGNGAN